MLIAIEGIDGSGKGTQAKRLYDGLVADGISCCLLSFPRYEATLFGRAIGDFLNGRFGTLEQVDPHLAALLYAGDRFESRDTLQTAIAEHDVVVLDRYVASNIAHQGAKCTGDQRQQLVEWISQIEYDIYQLPRADLTVLLDLPVSMAVELIARKSARTYTDQAADLQEADAEYLSAVRDLYQTLAATEPHWQQVAICDNNGGDNNSGTIRPPKNDSLQIDSLRTIDAISAEIRRVIDQKLADEKLVD